MIWYSGRLSMLLAASSRESSQSSRESVKTLRPSEHSHLMLVEATRRSLRIIAMNLLFVSAVRNPQYYAVM